MTFPPENKMRQPAEVKAGQGAQPAKGAVMCPSCGAWLAPGDSAGAITCGCCRMRVRLGLVP